MVTVVSRKSEREAQEVRRVENLIDDTLLDWGIEMHRFDDEPGGDPRPLRERFTPQIGPGESVEYDEVYDLIRDVALAAYKAGKEANSGLD